jgi:glycosyltransferase involved in cell wall biosynthesis
MVSADVEIGMPSGCSILHLIPTISRRGAGVAEAARLLVSALADALPGQVSVLTMKDAFTEIDRGQWPDIDIDVARFFGPSNFGFSPGLLLKLLLRRPTIVHVHGLWMFHCFCALVWSLMTNGQVVITVHGMLEPWILRRSPRLKWLVRRLFLDFLIARASRLHVVTEKESGDCRSVYPRARTVVIPYLVTLTSVLRPSVRLDRTNIEEDPREVFLFLGRLHEKKGCLELLDAWESVSTEDQKFRDRFALVFCGWPDGLDNFASDVEAVADRCGNVRYVGPKYGAEKIKTLTAATFFILPSKSEGLPMSILEAWAVGLIVLMTPECNALIGFERKAALRTGTNRDEIAQSLRRAAELSSEERLGMVARGRGLVDEFYSQAAVTRSMLKLYKDVLDERGKP